MSNYAEQIHRCFRCGYCKFPSDFVDYNCPSYYRFRFESYSPGGRLWLIDAWKKGTIKWTNHLAEILFSCSTCKNCTEQCPMKFSSDITEWIIASRRDIIEQSLSPPQVNEFLENIFRYSNPWGLPKSQRGDWARGVDQFTAEHEYLLYIGCVGSYDQRGQKMAKNFVEILKNADISFGILGSEENCDGNEVYMLGEVGLYRELAKKNVEKFKTLGVKKIVTLSPHAFNIMKNEYFGMGNITVLHYTQVLNELIQNNNLSTSDLDRRVTYHDPCFLGRYNQIYETPRRILHHFQKLKFVEMDKHHENAFCCGGGSGNFVYDLLGKSSESPSRVRIREAFKTGAESLVTACPSCLMMLDDALNAEGLEKKLNVIDFTDLILDRL